MRFAARRLWFRGILASDVPILALPILECHTLYGSAGLTYDHPGGVGDSGEGRNKRRVVNILTPQFLGVEIKHQIGSQDVLRQSQAAPIRTKQLEGNLLASRDDIHLQLNLYKVLANVVSRLEGPTWWSHGQRRRRTGNYLSRDFARP